MWEECKVRVKGDESIELKDGILVGVMQVSDVIPPSPFAGGHTGGVVSGPVAVVKMDGGLKKVHVNDIVFEPKMPIKDPFLEQLERTYAKESFLDKVRKEREKNPVKVEYIVVHDTYNPNSTADMIKKYFDEARELEAKIIQSHKERRQS